jgi:hypothetical protein
VRDARERLVRGDRAPWKQGPLLGTFRTHRDAGSESVMPVCTENLNPDDVVVMQSAKDGMRFDTSGRLNWARDRRVFIQ